MDSMVEDKKENKCCGCLCFKPEKKEQDEIVDEEFKREHQTADEYAEDQLLPYCAELTKLSVGQLICITGYVNFRCRRFSINLVCSQNPNGDVAFHFNPRMEQRYVVRNCRIRGHWGDEETCSITQFDFKVGSRFKVDILVGEKEFMISVNGKHWCAFTYRVPLEKIIGIEIRGKVDIQEVIVKDIESYPVIPEPAVVVAVNHDKQKDRAMPFIGKLARPLNLGWALEISGRLKMLPQNFYINLQDGLQMWPHPIVPLHLNPRFSTDFGVDVFVRNSWLENCWGPEERAPIFPFLAGATFKLLIVRQMDYFTIWVDDKVVADFKFRGGVNEIRYVYINGDVIITNVTLRAKDRDLLTTGVEGEEEQVEAVEEAKEAMEDDREI